MGQFWHCASECHNSVMHVSLREVTSETLRTVTALKVAPEQEHFVASNALSIAEAYFEREVAWFRAIYLGSEPSGFVMVEQDFANQEFFLWRFMVDARFQGRGIGRLAMGLVIEHVRSLGCTRFETGHVVGVGCPGPFYEKLGFTYTGQEEDGELQMVLVLE